MTDDALPLQRKPWRPFRSRAPRVAVVRLSGILSASGNQSLNLASLAKPLNKAFRGKPDAVALQINPPWFAAKSTNATRILALSKEHQVPVYAFARMAVLAAIGLLLLQTRSTRMPPHWSARLA